MARRSSASLSLGLSRAELAPSAADVLLRNLLSVADAYRPSRDAAAIYSPTDPLLADRKKQVAVPVTTADDFSFWNQDTSKDLARELDFVEIRQQLALDGERLSKTIELMVEKKWIKLNLQNKFELNQ